MISEKNNYVYSIGGLFLSKENISEVIVEDINEFISIAPTLAENVRTSLTDRKNTYWFMQHMSMVQFLLKSVNAKWLQTEAEAILRAAEADHMALCRKKIEPFISDFLALSIEMQMAQNRAAEERGENKKNAMEAYTDSVNILTAVSRLIAASEYGKAKELLVNVEDTDGNSVMELMEVLNQGNGAVAAERVKQLQDKFRAKIEELAGLKNIDKKEVMAVDDRTDVLRTVAGVLREHYKVLTATEGSVALKILEKKKPDLFILDIDMPGMNGFELTRHIRQMKDFAQTPILFLTSNSTREYVIKAVEAGGSDFIVKPANHSTLLSKVGRYLFTQ